MVKPPQRPTPKTGAQKSSTSGGGQASKSMPSGDNKKTAASTPRSGAASGTTKSAPAGSSANTGGRSSAKRAATADVSKPDAKLTAKPTTIDLKANEPKKPAPSKSAGSTPSAAPKASGTPSTASSPAGMKKTEQADRKNTSSASAGTTKMGTADKAPEAVTEKPKAPAAKPSVTSASSTSAPKETAAKTQRRGGTSFLALLLAGIFGGIITLLGAFALLGSGTMSGLLADKSDEQVNDTDIQVEKLSEDVSGLSARMAELHSSLADMSAIVNEEQPDLSAPLTDVQNEISAVQAQLAELAARADAAGSADGTALADIQSQMATDAADSARKLEALTNQLSELANQQAALESSVSTGNAGEAPALAALEQRLAGLADAQQAQGASVPPAVREELSTLEEELQKLAIQMAVMENLQLLAEEQQAELTELSSAVETVAQKTDRLEASSEVEPPAESGLMVGSQLSYLQGALKEATMSSVPFVGLLTEAKTFLAQHNSAVELPESLMQSATTGVMPLSVIASQIETARAEYEASKTNTADATDPQDDSVSADGVLEGLVKGAQSLITIRSTEPPAEPASTDPIAVLLAEAEAMARGEDLSALSDRLSALAAQETTPGSLKDNVGIWQEQVAYHQALAGLADQIKAVQQTIWAQAAEGERP